MFSDVLGLEISWHAQPDPLEWTRSKEGVPMIVWLSAASTAFAVPGMVTNTRTGTNYTTVSAAIAAAQPGDRLRVDGSFDEHVQVTRDVFLDGRGMATSEITWEGAGNAIVEMDANVSLHMADVDLRSTTQRGIAGLVGANTLILESATLSTRPVTGDGGGVLLTSAVSATIDQSTFDHTAAVAGGAIKVSEGVVRITDCAFDHTSATTNGGAISISLADLECTGCSFLGTTAGSNGGAVYDQGTSTMTFEDTTFDATTSGSTGGALSLSSTSVLTVTRGRFCNNAATSGGAIGGSPTTATITASVFTSSSAGSGGGALHAAGGAWTLTNDDVLGTTNGVGVRVQGTASLVATDVLFADIPDTALEVGGSATATIKYSDFFGNQRNATGANLTVGNVYVDPLLRSWTDDGDCSNDDLLPRWDSPLLDAGDPTLRDPDNSVSDIGAFGGPDADPAAHADADSDGFSFVADCDDAHATAHPGGIELCNHVDDDCDGDVDEEAVNIDSYYEDCDRDGQGVAATRVDQCFAPAGACAWVGYSTAGEDAWSDCDDSNRNVYFGADEHCAPGDQNCDGDDDLGAVDAALVYVDGDSDGYGAEPLNTCVVNLPGTVTNDDDCNDQASTIHPGAPDPCGDALHLDSDCNGGDGDASSIKPWFPDTDSDGYGDPNGVPRLDCQDQTAAGYSASADATDCDDTLSSVYPGAAEVCNLVDDDCDLTIDDVGEDQTWYEDGDGDGYGDERFPFVDDCAPDEHWLSQGDDCDDVDADVHPGATETCNDVDDDCDGALDAADGAVDAVTAWPDIDHDGFGGCVDGSGDCPPDALCPDELDQDWSDNAEDCNDGIATINPDQEEIPGDDIDQDCDGVAQPSKTPVVEEPEGCQCDQSSGVPLALTWLAPLFLRRRRR